MCNSRIHWTADGVVQGVAAFLQGTRRQHLRKEIQAVLNCSPSTADKLVLGSMPSISAHVLLNLDTHFEGELLRSLRGLPEDEAKRKMNYHLEALRRLTR